MQFFNTHKWKEPKVCFENFSKARAAKVGGPVPKKVTLFLHSDECSQRWFMAIGQGCAPFRLGLSKGQVLPVTITTFPGPACRPLPTSLLLQHHHHETCGTPPTTLPYPLTSIRIGRHQSHRSSGTVDVSGEGKSMNTLL